MVSYRAAIGSITPATGPVSMICNPRRAGTNVGSMRQSRQGHLRRTSSLKPSISTYRAISRMTARPSHSSLRSRITSYIPGSINELCRDRPKLRGPHSCILIINCPSVERYSAACRLTNLHCSHELIGTCEGFRLHDANNSPTALGGSLAFSIHQYPVFWCQFSISM